MNSNNTPLMHTWRYQHSSFPNTTAHKHALDMLQVRTGYKWHIDFAQASLEVVQVIKDKVGNFQNGALAANSCHRQAWGHLL